MGMGVGALLLGDEENTYPGIAITSVGGKGVGWKEQKYMRTEFCSSPPMLASLCGGRMVCGLWVEGGDL